MTRAYVVAFALGMASLVMATGFGAAPALAQTAVSAEARARAVVGAYSTGDANGLERTVQTNYSAAAAARRQPAERARTLQQMSDTLGTLTITNLSASGDQVVVNAHGAKGVDAVFTFTIGAAPEQRIESLSIQTTAPLLASRTSDPYAGYAFLIGEWDTPGPANAPEGAIHQVLRWGPSHSYIWYAVYVGQRGQAGEDLHQEGLMTFNAQHNNLDFLFVHEPGSFGEEQGTVHVEPDGSVVRETTAVGGDGVVTHFRQVWRQTGPNTAVTSLMRQNANGSWAPNFPGADNLVMTRRRT